MPICPAQGPRAVCGAVGCYHVPVPCAAMHGPRAVGVLALGAGQCCLVVGSAVLSTALLIVLMDPLPSPSYVSSDDANQ